MCTSICKYTGFTQSVSRALRIVISPSSSRSCNSDSLYLSLCLATVYTHISQREKTRRSYTVRVYIQCMEARRAQDDNTTRTNVWRVSTRGKCQATTGLRSLRTSSSCDDTRTTFEKTTSRCNGRTPGNLYYALRARLCLWLIVCNCCFNCCVDARESRAGNTPFAADCDSTEMVFVYSGFVRRCEPSMTSPGSLDLPSSPLRLERSWLLWGITLEMDGAKVLIRVDNLDCFLLPTCNLLMLLLLRQVVYSLYFQGGLFFV